MTAQEGGGPGRPPRQVTKAEAFGVERITEGRQPPAQHRGDAKVCVLYSSKGEDKRGRHLPTAWHFHWASTSPWLPPEPVPIWPLSLGEAAPHPPRW